MEEGTSDPGEAPKLTHFGQIGPQIAEMLRFLRTEHGAQDAAQAKRLFRRQYAQSDAAYEREDVPLDDLCAARQFQAIYDALLLALDGIEGRVLASKGAAQSALGKFQSWYELEKERDAAKRQGKQGKK